MGPARGAAWDPTLEQRWLRGTPGEPPRLDPGNVDPAAPEWFNPYTAEHLKRPETVAELHDIYYMDRSEEEKIAALEVLRMAMIGGGQPKEEVFPEALAADALELMKTMKDTGERWKVLANLGGLEYPTLREEALYYLRNDESPRVRERAALALAPFCEEPDVEDALEAARWDFSHEVRSGAKSALAGDWKGH